MGTITDEIGQYQKFITATHAVVHQDLPKASRKCSDLRKQAVSGYGTFLSQSEELAGHGTELVGYLEDKKDSTSNKQLLSKYVEPFLLGKKGANQVAERLYGNIEFKSATSERSRAFARKFKKKGDLKKFLAHMLKLRSKVTFSLNAVLTSQAKLATLDAAIFRSRYYLSGSLLNHSSSMPISRGFGQKLAHARKVVDSLGSDHQDKARFVKIIEEKSDTVQELMSRVAELDPSQRWFVYCEHGVRSVAACEFLATAGFQDLTNIRGGMAHWASCGLPFDRGA